jgi:hypothetical protein
MELLFMAKFRKEVKWKMENGEVISMVYPSHSEPTPENNWGVPAEAMKGRAEGEAFGMHTDPTGHKVESVRAKGELDEAAKKILAQP